MKKLLLILVIASTAFVACQKSSDLSASKPPKTYYWRVQSLEKAGDTTYTTIQITHK